MWQRAGRAQPWPKTTLKLLAAAGILTPNIAHAAWVRQFPTCPRAVSREEGDAFVCALGAELGLQTIAMEEIRACGTGQLRGTYKTHSNTHTQ